MFEHKSDPLLPWPAFLRRLATSATLGLALISVSLAVGMVGYHWCESLSWLDAFANAAKILSGMGPLAQPQTTAGDTLRRVLCPLQRLGGGHDCRHHLCSRRPSVFAPYSCRTKCRGLTPLRGSQPHSGDHTTDHGFRTHCVCRSVT